MNVESLFLQVPVPEDGKLWLWVILVLCGVVAFLFPLLWRAQKTNAQESLKLKDQMFEELKKAKDEEIARLKKENDMLVNQNNQMMIDVISQSKFGSKAVEATNVMLEKVLTILHELRNNVK